MKPQFGDLIIIKTAGKEIFKVLNVPVIFLCEEQKDNETLFYTVLSSQCKHFFSIKKSDEIVVLSEAKDAV